VLPDPLSTPAVTLTDTAGAPTQVQSITRGGAPLVYFGYTHCPDVCPTTMADTAAAMRGLPADVRRRTRVVFVTSDPHRDTGPVIARWLSGFDFGAGTTVTGLTGDYATITRLANAYGVGLEAPVVTAGNYTVGHGTRLTGLTTEGTAPVSWLPESTDHLTSDLEHDVPLLLRT